MAAILQTLKETIILFLAFPTFDFYHFSINLIGHDPKQNSSNFQS